MTNKLAKWSSNYGITLQATRALLDILRTEHPELPLTAESLRQTSKKRLQVKILQNGEYVHLGFAVLFELLDVTRLDGQIIEVDVNIDGLSIHKSSGKEAWPILIRCSNGGVKRPVPIGLFYGVGKPRPLRSYLEDFIQDVQQLAAEGVLIQNRRYQFGITKFVCDALARAYLKCCMGHKSHHGCEKCEQEGYSIGKNTVYLTASGRLRHDQSFLNQSDPQHHNGVSPLVELNLGLVSQFVLDPMHLVDYGCVKRFLEFVLSKGRLNARMSPAQRNLFDTLIIQIQASFPSDFSRHLRSFGLSSKWKSVECRYLLLYIGPIVFARVLKEEVYKCFLLLHAGIFILNSELLINLYLDEAEQYLSNYVPYSEEIFGPIYIYHIQRSQPPPSGL